jgi:hypothetical protein
MVHTRMQCTTVATYPASEAALRARTLREPNVALTQLVEVALRDVICVYAMSRGTVAIPSAAEPKAALE